MEDRIVTLETKLLAAEDLLDALNRTVWRQQQELDLLRETGPPAGAAGEDPPARQPATTRGRDPAALVSGLRSGRRR